MNSEYTRGAFAKRIGEGVTIATTANQALQDNLKLIQHLVGPVTKEQIKYVDCFATRHLGLFMPVGGACRYALSEEHTHPAFMFVLAFDDHTRIKMAGRILATRPGQIFALSPDIPHTEMPGDLPPRYLAMMIDRDFWHEQLREYPEVEYMKLNGEFFEPSSDLLPTCRKFMIEYQNSGPGTETILHALSIELCHYLIRTIWRFAQPLKPVSSRFEIDRVVEFIHGNLERKITSGDMARIACMSQSNFTRVFRKEMGTSPYDYLLGSRLARAKKMLQAGEKPISDIAQECGFSSTSHFSAKFSKKYNLSPATYRKAFG